MFKLLLQLSFIVVLLTTIYCGEEYYATIASTHHIARYPDGTIHAEYDLDAEGFIHGKMIEYWRNGEVRTVSEFRHGVATGASEHYTTDGAPE
jgi:antitoxin component YwqK of YwqJK toxin-antitoxin module